MREVHTALLDVLFPSIANPNDPLFNQLPGASLCYSNGTWQLIQVLASVEQGDLSLVRYSGKSGCAVYSDFLFY